MNSDRFALGLATIASTTGLILSSIAVATQPETKDLGECILDLFVSRRITAQRYFFNRNATQTQPIISSTFESVGDTFFEEEDPAANPTFFSGSNHVLVFKRGFAVKPSPTQVIETSTSINFQSANPINFYANQLTLKGQVINPTSPSFILTGLKGEKGEQGQEGETGDIGIKGIKGEPGNQGMKALIGLQGPLGVQGTDGKDGLKGQKGVDGFPGLTGLSGDTFDFAKIWPDQKSKDDDEATNPRPPDFPAAGEYGLVSDDGKVYLSDGLNLTEVDDISQQGMHGEKGEKGTKGEKGIEGKQGSQPAPGPKGDIGLKGFVGVPGITKGEKGESSGVPGAKGDPGDSGDLGIKGPQGQKGDFSLDDFDAVTLPIVTSIVQGTPADNYTIEVFNPVYSLPVRVYAWATSTTPTAQEIVDNGELITVEIDFNGQGNQLYVNDGDQLWFTWLDNDVDPQDVIGPFTGPSLSFSVTALQTSTYDLFIDGTFAERITIPGGPDPVAFTFVGSLGQSYLIQWVDQKSDIFCEPSISEGDPVEGTVGGPVNVMFDCFPLETVAGTLVSDVKRNISISVTSPNGSTVFQDELQGVSPGPFVYPDKYPRFGSYLLFIFSFNEPCQGASGVIPEGGVNDVIVGCNFPQLIMNFDQGGRRTFTLTVNGSTRGTYELFSGQAIPDVIAPGDSWQVIADPADLPNVPSRAGTMGSSNLTVNFSYPQRPYRVQVTTQGVVGGVFEATYELILNFYPPEKEVKTFSGGNGFFDTRASTGNEYQVRFVSIVPNDPFQANCGNKTSSSSTTISGPIRDPLVGVVGTRDVDIAVRPCGDDSNIPI